VFACGLGIKKTYFVEILIAIIIILKIICKAYRKCNLPVAIYAHEILYKK